MLFLLLAVFKMGWISQFLSKAVITGFLFGAAIDVVVGELPKLTGTEPAAENVWQEFVVVDRGLGGRSLARRCSWEHLAGSALRAASVAPNFPGRSSSWSGGMLASVLLDLGAHGVALVGDVPRGLPLPGIPDLACSGTTLATVGIAAVGIVLIGFSQTAGDARHFATKHRYQIESTRRPWRRGWRTSEPGLFQGIPVSTSLSASSLNDNVGREDPIASLTTGGIMILTLLVLAPVFSDLPKPVLGAVIIEAVVMGMMDVPEMRRLQRVKRSDFWIAMAAILGVLSFGVLAGIVIGVVLSVGLAGLRVHPPAMPSSAACPVRTSSASRGTPRGRAVPRACRAPARRRPVLRHRRRPRGPHARALPRRRTATHGGCARLRRASHSSTPRGPRSSGSSSTWRGRTASPSGGPGQTGGPRRAGP